MEASRRQRFTHMEVNRITIVVWAIVKHITTSLEDKKDDFDKEMLYTPPQSPSKKNFVALEVHMFQDHRRRRSKTLLDYH
jgi:hypothetical protein